MPSETNDLSCKVFNPRHLSQVEETYWHHFKFGVWAGFVLWYLGLISIIHAFFPFLLSRYPDKIYKYFQKNSSVRLKRVESILKKKHQEKDDQYLQS
jgi:hypothetical protein